MKIVTTVWTVWIVYQGLTKCLPVDLTIGINMTTQPRTDTGMNVDCDLTIDTWWYYNQKQNDAHLYNSETYYIL